MSNEELLAAFIEHMGSMKQFQSDIKERMDRLETAVSEAVGNISSVATNIEQKTGAAIMLHEDRCLSAVNAKKSILNAQGWIALILLILTLLGALFGSVKWYVDAKVDLITPAKADQAETVDEKGNEDGRTIHE